MYINTYFTISIDTVLELIDWLRLCKNFIKLNVSSTSYQNKSCSRYDHIHHLNMYYTTSIGVRIGTKIVVKNSSAQAKKQNKQRNTKKTMWRSHTEQISKEHRERQMNKTSVVWLSEQNLPWFGFVRPTSIGFRTFTNN